MSRPITTVNPKARPFVRCRLNSHGEDAVTYDIIVSWWAYADTHLDGRDEGERFERRVLVTATSEDQARRFIMKDYDFSGVRIIAIGPVNWTPTPAAEERA